MFTRNLIIRARKNDDDTKQRLMLIVRGHQPASLQVHCAIADIMVSMAVIDMLHRQFAAVPNALMSCLCVRGVG